MQPDAETEEDLPWLAPDELHSESVLAAARDMLLVCFSAAVAIPERSLSIAVTAGEELPSPMVPLPKNAGETPFYFGSAERN